MIDALIAEKSWSYSVRYYQIITVVLFLCIIFWHVASVFFYFESAFHIAAARAVVKCFIIDYVLHKIQ